MSNSNNKPNYKKEGCLNSDLYCITAEKLSKGRKNIDVIGEMLNTGIKLIQYREKEKSMKNKYLECQEIRKLTKDYGATFIVNDHIDLALAVGADGVHIGQDDMPVRIVRELLGPDFLIGLSTHSPEQAEDAVKSGVDYIGVGPIYSSRTKKDLCEPVGIEYLKYVIDNINIPFVVIGGIKQSNIALLHEMGAECFCLISEIVAADNIVTKIKDIRSEIRE